MENYLTPYYDTIIIARKPCEGSCVDNVLKYGVGGINIDECRIPLESDYVYKETNCNPRASNVFTGETCGFKSEDNHTAVANPNGRFPSNVILTYDEETKDEVIGGMPYTTSTGGSGEASKINTFSNTYNGGWGHDKNCANLGGLGDEGSSARYFYNAQYTERDQEYIKYEVTTMENQEEQQKIHLYSEGKEYKLYQGNMLELLDVIESNSIDSIVTDPPYELNFMNKGWDNSGIAFQVDTWKKCFDVLKPGGYLIAFGGSRTHHRIMCAIEDAGFEIRDTIMYLFGSGFPKSMNISLAIDKRNEIDNKGEMSVTSEDAKRWQGWGTALKPAYESITVAMKPLSDELFDNVISIIKEIITICQLSSDVQLVEKISQLNPVVLNGVVDTVPKNVNKNNKWVDLLEVMGILQLCVMESMNWNIVSLCLKYLEEICYHQSKFTIEMRTSLIIDLKTLNSLLVPDILQNTMLPSETSQHGIMPNVSTVEKFLLDAIKKLNDILMNFVVESATKRVEESNLLPNYEGITVARKPCEGSCIDNILKYGVGGINIDECRISFQNAEDYAITANKNQHEDFGTKPLTGNIIYGDYSMVQPKNYEADGRFPSNVILTYDETDKEEVIGNMPNTISNGGSMTMPDFKDAGQKNSYNKIGFNDGDTAERKSSDYVAPIDSGSAARYFYCAKASKRDRDEGLADFSPQVAGSMDSSVRTVNPLGSASLKDQPKPVVPKRNVHPTVKPTALMQYLIRLVTPKGGTVLDPFNGSGSTGKAVMYENNDRNANYSYIGVELSGEYLAISDARIKYAITAKDIIPEKPISEEKKKLINNQMNLFDISNN